MDFNHFALAQQLGWACRKQQLRIALAESCTGGAVSQVITSVPGSSLWFDAGFVVYSNEAKTQMLSVDPIMIAQFGAVSEAVAKAMAQGALDNSSADLAISITGIAGPHGGSTDKPVGTVWFALADKKQGTCEAIMQSFEGGRQHIRQSAVEFVLERFFQHIKC